MRSRWPLPENFKAQMSDSLLSRRTRSIWPQRMLTASARRRPAVCSSRMAARSRRLTGPSAMFCRVVRMACRASLENERITSICMSRRLLPRTLATALASR
ncbi:hypothetical protein D3C85_1582690 [compost metagenome]